MILRNYDNIMLARTCPNIGLSFPVSTADSFGDGKINVKDNSGVIRIIYPNNSAWCYDPFSYFTEYRNTDTSLDAGYSNLICGSGSTPEHYDDYNLESLFTDSQISRVSGVHKIETALYDESTKSWTFTYTRNFLATEDITVREIGVNSGFYYTSSSSRRTSCLVYRKVLETPLVVTAGNQFSLTFTTVISANPNKPANYDASAAVV